MGVESVRRDLEEKNFDGSIIELTQSTATVEKAASALGVEARVIAKTLAFSLKDRSILVVTRGDARIDNKKMKDTFQKRARMLQPDEIAESTGHPVGGVCPFGLKNPLDIYLDESLRAFDYIYSGAGAPNAMARMTPGELQRVTGGTWVDVCQ